MAGLAVSREAIDTKTGQTVLTLRAAFDQVKNISQFLANNPNDGTNDPLIDTYGYTIDEAYMIRLVFQDLEAIRTNNASTFDIASKLTGLD